MAQERISPKLGTDVDRLLDALDAGGQKAKVQSRRGAPRVRYRKPSVEILITHPGGGTVSGYVPTRDLSNSGLSFLYWGFLHNGTRVGVTLTRRDGTRDSIAGLVRYCRYLGTNQHLIGLQFEERIFAQLYAVVGGKNADASAPKHHVLLVDDQEMDRMLFVHQLAGTRMEPHAVGTVAEAVSMIRMTQLDLIVCDLNLAEMTGEEAIRQFRAAGFKGFVAAMTAESSCQRLQAARQAGAQTILQKPCPPEVLRATLTQHLAGQSRPNEPIFSTLAAAPGADGMVFTYVETVRILVKEIQEAMSAQNFQQLRTHCQTLKGTGEGYGFPLLSVVALEAVNALDQSQKIENAAPAVQNLLDICRRLTSGKPAA